MTKGSGSKCIIRTVALTAELDLKIEQLAKKDGMSVSALVRRWIKEEADNKPAPATVAAAR